MINDPMLEASSAGAPRPLRTVYAAEPDQLRLPVELRELQRYDAAEVAIRTLVAAGSLERIADHATVIGARLLFLVTGDTDHLANEVR